LNVVGNRRNAAAKISDSRKTHFNYDLTRLVYEAAFAFLTNCGETFRKVANILEARRDDDFTVVFMKPHTPPT
jgi:hypothetical protein